MVSRFTRWGVGGVAALILAQATVSAAVFYVDGGATGANDGSSWADAFANLQTAIDAARPDADIWMAEGVYYPPNTGFGREAAFHLKDGVRIYGGFPSGATSVDERDPKTYRSILSGDLNDDDSETPESYSDNCYHVLVANDSAGIVLDGMEVTGGNADGAEPKQQSGGGIFANGNLTIVGCRITNNRAITGGGLYCYPRLNRVTEISLRDCRIENNIANGDGGGVYLGDSDLQFESCVISGNTAGQRGGGIYHGYDAHLNCEQTVFGNNAAMDDGGAVYHQQGQPAYESCRFEENRAVKNGGAICNDHSESRFADCVFEGNHAMGCDPGWPCDPANGGGIYSDGGTTTVAGCRLIANKAMQGGGIYQGQGVLSVGDSQINLNFAWDCGGGMYLRGAESRLDQCVLVRNCADDYGGGGIWNCQGSLHVLQSSMAGNWASDGGSGIYNYDHGSLSVVNSIIRDAVTVNYSSVFTSSYSNIVGGEWGSDETTMDVDPMFCVEPSGRCLGEEGSLGDLRLKEGSPCINAGDNDAAHGVAGDLDDRPRIQGGRVDMGAYEYSGRRIIYVDDSATGSNDGSCWGDAFTRLQDALAVATPGQEIQVAQGIYRPADPNGSRQSAFVLKGGVVVRGGYAGFDATDPDARDIRRFESILSGDLDGDDPISSGDSDGHINWYGESRNDNSYNVVRATGMHSGTVLEGFTVAGSNDGSAMLCIGAIALEVRDCLFCENKAEQGGGFYDSGGTNCCVTHCVFKDNNALEGGAVYLRGWSYMILDHCLIVGNQAEWGGGIYLDEAYTSIVNCTVAHNRARDQWGGVAAESGPSHFWSCIFWGNTCESDIIEKAQIGRNFGNATFDFCCVQGWTGKFAGVGTIDQYPLFIHPGYWDTKGTYNYDDDIWFPGDYHLKSQAGRWDASVKAWVQDAATSPCIDAGDPGTPIMYEPFPNGGVINMGAYGGTAEASKSYFGKPGCEVIVAGDINGDCKVDLGDFAIMARHWLEAN